MDVKRFNTQFLKYFPVAEQNSPTSFFENAFTRSYFDPCFDIEGMTSVKKQKLLNLAFSLLPASECYVEIGTYQGKSLISAIRGNTKRPVYACDNFSQFAVARPGKVLMANLDRYGLADGVIFYRGDFQVFLQSDIIRHRIGVYFYDGAHDFESQYKAITQAESKLADEALVIIDDWRFSGDSKSYAAEGTRKAITESRNKWELFHVLPARYNGDHGLWWNGVGILSFRRR